MSNKVHERDVRRFWAAHPCGEALVEGFSERDKELFFQRYDEYRYGENPNILRNLDRIDFEGKRVLEIGLGLGADGEQIIRRGGIWTGIDLTHESVQLVRLRFNLRGLNYENLVLGSACALPFKEKSFDIVYSYGVLHHIPEIDIAQQEIARVLLPEGKLIAMVYAKYSMNYLLSICLLRRMGLAGAFMLGLRPSGKVEEHLENARRMGIRRYLKMENFIHRNTDGPLNPYSKVYDLKEVREDFSSFRVLKGYKEFMHAPPLPVHRLPLTRLLGWHLWLHMAPVKEG